MLPITVRLTYLQIIFMSIWAGSRCTYKIFLQCYKYFIKDWGQTMYPGDSLTITYKLKIETGTYERDSLNLKIQKPIFTKIKEIQEVK